MCDIVLRVCAASRVGVSPDAYLQMALQITYFRNMERFPLTYESAMARLFKQVWLLLRGANRGCRRALACGSRC